ncbi:cytochrome P450 [Gigaspora rosea]|uniref:Cytochrome P450 n=1 Tax=Gigaspora rosea TaxID=44941 RepID=A0A397WD52_9GLOM|nr:cytochrome P450 [Gigaspora rosea]
MAIYTLLSTFKVTDFLILIGFSFIVYVCQFYYKYFTRPNKLPGPIPLPFLECSYLLTGNSKQLFMSLQEKYGDICEFYLTGSRRIVISRPDYIEKILTPSSKDTTFMLRFPYFEGLVELGVSGRGIISNHDIKSWRFNRQFFDNAVLKPSFNNEAVEWSNILTQELEKYWESLGKLSLSNDNLQDHEWSLETDITKWAHRFACDMITIVITGERSYSMASHHNAFNPVKITHSDTVIEDSEKFIQGFKNHLAGFILFLYFNPFLRHYAPFVKDQVKATLDNRDYLFEILDTMIKKRRQEIEEMPVGTELKNDMLTSLIITNTERDVSRVNFARDNIFRPMTDVEIRGNLLDSFQGGIDTTANTFSFIVYYVCQHPKVKQKMIDEIDSIFPPNTSYHLKYDDLLKLEYCDAIINEVSRLHPIVIELQRYVKNPCEIAGYRFEAGTVIHINTNGIHTHKDHWPNPEIFDPDRFYKKSETKNMNNKVRHKFSLLTFGGGLRICPGRRLAMIELLSLMVILFGKHDVELVDMNAKLNVNYAATTTCEELPIKIKLRK